MIGILAAIVAMWVLLVVAPDTPIVRALHAMIVVSPARRLNRLTAGHVALVAIAAVAIGTVAWVGEGDGVRMLAMAAPDVAAWLTTFEITAYLDVMVTAFAAWSAARLRWPVLPSSLRRATPRRRRIVRKEASGRPPANDDEPGDRRRCA